MPITAKCPGSTPVAGFDMQLKRSTKAGEPLSDEDRLWPGLMRHAARAHASLWRLDHLADTVDLLVSELVTNALQHGEGAVDVRLARSDGRLYFEAGSASPCVPRVRDASPYDENGRGMFLVTLLADEWGVTPGGAWCALRLDGAGA
ncbi:ATP-binding protein [Streptomyces sp. NPDC020412]|uniref:ATP-binding protein n=1 Tax=Streptomyces sp. NPDC020412 TaxID=3365073 RepID=UPI0037B233F4